MKDAFTDWYADCVAQAVHAHGEDANAAVAALKPDLQLSTLKPLHTRPPVVNFEDLPCSTSSCQL